MAKEIKIIEKHKPEHSFKISAKRRGTYEKEDA